MEPNDFCRKRLCVLKETDSSWYVNGIAARCSVARAFDNLDLVPTSGRFVLSVSDGFLNSVSIYARYMSVLVGISWIFRE